VKGTDDTKNTTAGIPALVDKAAAAALLGGVSVRTVDRLRLAGELTTQPVGPRLVRIDVKSIEDYLARQRGADPSAPEAPADPFAIPAIDQLRAEAKARRQQKAAAHAA
jgi:hypothetical protein